MERKYKAFISYRHLPLDAQVAKAVHRSIERFVIPRRLRINGEKRLGLVFRDEDELPIAGPLSSNIERALDNSEYLIVICTPETGKSPWVLKEIDYFLRHHDRDHILTILADGGSGSFLPILTDVYTPEGQFVARVEPLAANISADTDAKRKKLFKTEILRIIASLIGCAYDELYQRQLRYKKRRLAALLSLAGAVAAAFIAVLLVKNAQISRQLEESQINESIALAALSENAFSEGDLRGALEYALAALPSEEKPRPYVPQARYALSQELNLYNQGHFAYAQTIKQQSNISKLWLSQNGDRLITADGQGTVRVYDMLSGELIREFEGESRKYNEYLEASDILLMGDYSSISAYTVDGAELLWQAEQSKLCMDTGADGKTGIFSSYYSEDGIDLVDLSSGAVTASYPLELELSSLRGICLSPDTKHAAFISYDTPQAALYVLELDSGELRLLADSLPYDFSMASKICFTPQGDVVYAQDAEGRATLMLFDSNKDWACRFETGFETSDEVELINNSIVSGGWIGFLDADSEKIWFGGRKHIVLVDVYSGQLLWSGAISSPVVSGRLYENNDLAALVLTDGLISFASGNRVFSHQVGLNSFECDFGTFTAAIAGQTPEKAVFAVVPSDTGDRAMLVCKVNSPLLSPVIDNISWLLDAGMIGSPSGRLSAAVSLGYDTNRLHGILFDVGNDYAKKEFEIDHELKYINGEKLFLTEDGKLIYYDLVYDMGTGDILWLTDSEHGRLSGVNSYVQSSVAGQDVVTAAISADAEGALLLSLWKNAAGERRIAIPQEYMQPWTNLYSCHLEGLGGKAAVLHIDDSICIYLTEEDTWLKTELPEEVRSKPIAVGECSTLMAYCSGADKVQILDGKNGKTTATCLDTASLRKLAFALDDTLLLGFYDTGRLALCDARSGQVLNSFEFNRYNVSFNEYAKYQLHPMPETEQLLIIYSHNGYTEACSIILDTAHWELSDMYSAVVNHVSGKTEIMIKPYYETIYKSRLLSLDELIAEARKITG